MIALIGFGVGQLAAVLEIYGRRYLRRYQDLNLALPKTWLWLPGLEGLHRDYLRARQIARMTGRKPRWLTAFELLQVLAFGCVLLLPLSMAFEAWRAAR